MNPEKKKLKITVHRKAPIKPSHVLFGDRARNGLQHNTTQHRLKHNNHPKIEQLHLRGNKFATTSNTHEISRDVVHDDHGHGEEVPEDASVEGGGGEVLALEHHQTHRDDGPEVLRQLKADQPRLQA